MKVFCGRCQRDFEFSGERPKFCGHCGNTLDAALTVASSATDATTRRERASADEEEAAPDSVGGYKLTRRLGAGAMGAVYEAEDSASGRLVAVKLIQSELTDSDGALQRFRQEGRLASTLANPRAVFVLAADEDKGRPYIVMELMPGNTLDDLVKEHGPLPPEQAILKILDVIEGLEAAHQLGLIHRDVKPSNCFLESSGRVKIGDFGLVKSGDYDSKLTRTGTFLGTPLYASPEQIKCENVDAQSDLYSVAATLYFLLTGRAPFQGGDAMAALARIVSENPLPMAELRPGLPRALDKVVLRGLERDRKRRWRNLDEFRNALLSFLPAQPSIGGMGFRFGAYTIDYCIEMAIQQPIVLFLLVPLRGSRELLAVGAGLVFALVFFLNFGLLESLCGWSLGKRLLRLRVGLVTGSQPPGLARGLARAGIFYSLLSLGPFIGQIFAVMAISGKPTGAMEIVALTVAGFFSGLWPVIGVLLLVLPMRPINGFRGLHEILSGTRTYRLTWPRRKKRQALAYCEMRMPVTSPRGLPEKVGPFRVRGALRWTDRESLVLSEDPQLGRPVLICLRSASELPVDEAARAVSRGTRVRWLACGLDEPWRWDAFLAPGGCTLPTLVADGGPLSWTETRPIVEDLVEELTASLSDGTLPTSLTVDQVWVQPNGRVQLLGAASDHPADPLADQERTLRFIREVVVLALEGNRLERGAPCESVRALLPVHAESIVHRLLPVRGSYESLGQLSTDLQATRDRPTSVTRLRRVGHLALTAVLLAAPLCVQSLLFEELPKSLSGLATAEWVQCAVVGLSAGFWVVWAFLLRGGFAFHRGGIALRRADGSKPTRLQCGFRALVVWAPIAVLLWLEILAPRQYMEQTLLFWDFSVLDLLFPVLYVILAIWFPTRSLHDRLAGTYLVPE
jgi:hypothetical protein